MLVYQYDFIQFRGLCIVNPKKLKLSTHSIGVSFIILTLGVVFPVPPVSPYIAGAAVPAVHRCSSGETPSPSTHRSRCRYHHQNSISWYTVTRLVLNERLTR